MCWSFLLASTVYANDIGEYPRLGRFAKHPHLQSLAQLCAVPTPLYKTRAIEGPGCRWSKPKCYPLNSYKKLMKDRTRTSFPQFCIIDSFRRGRLFVFINNSNRVTWGDTVERGFILMWESRPNKVFWDDRTWTCEKDAALDGVTHMDPQHHFSSPRVWFLNVSKVTSSMNAHALSKHLPLHTFVVVALQENGYFTNNPSAAAVVARNFPVTYS